MKYDLVVCGGTFDHFHGGHQEFLNYVLSMGEKIIIGLTSDKYVQESKTDEGIDSYQIRETSLEEFLSQKKVQDKVTILKIDDLFGPTLSRDLSIDAIVVSDDTKKGADIINQKRQEFGLSLLEVLTVSSVMAEDGKPISSQRIRSGQISRMGQLYVNPLWLKENLVLPEDLRQELKEPFGELIREGDFKSDLNLSNAITVGDATTKKFNESSPKPNLSVVDFRIARQEIFSSFSELGFLGGEKVITVNNPSGHITADLFSAIAKIFESDFENRIILRVIGEEDLAVLPLILSAPLNSVIFYGQPGEGLVKVLVSESIKNKAYNLVSKLKPIPSNTRGY